ncbi:D-alanyl-D-alanine carboxypeptidase [Clostridia bacterium]|nr:D-alanyl-D-alanine carboxypeptidase [Clostridia bacterium]
MKIFRAVILIFLCCVLNFQLCFAEPTLELKAKSALLIEETTGKVLYGKDENLKVYPASITKVLTCLVALEYLDENEFVTVGDEINSVPYDSSKAGNRVGESLRVDNMMRLILIPSGNETSCVAAREVARRVTGNPAVSYAEAERVFADLMNKKAKELGAADSNFVNPHGYYDINHYTTASDMAKICRAAMGVPLIRQIVSEKRFKGSGSPVADEFTQEYNFVTHNELLVTTSEYYYPYATGIKTGTHDQAGDCLAASAERDGKKLIALAFDSPDGGRWTDTITLFDYGFDNFNFETLHTKDSVIEEIKVKRPPLGVVDTAQILADSEYKDFLTESEFANIKPHVVYDKKYVEDGLLLTPIEAGTKVGTITYSISDKVLYSGDLISAASVQKRTFSTDTKYYLDAVRTKSFTRAAVPYWIAFVSLLFIASQIAIAQRKRRRNKSFTMRNRRKKRRK